MAMVLTVDVKGRFLHLPGHSGSYVDLGATQREVNHH